MIRVKEMNTLVRVARPEIEGSGWIGKCVSLVVVEPSNNSSY